MLQTKAELILASKNALTGDLLMTFKLTYPRILLAECNTHSILVKNTASSRAIPTIKHLKNILNNPFIPSYIGEYKSGMQSGEEITGFRRTLLERLWSVSRYAMVGISFLAYRLGAAKQFTNRLTEPWMWVEQISSGTCLENEILLRDHEDAEPHYHELARQKAKIITDVKSYFKEIEGLTAEEIEDTQSEYRPITYKCQVLGIGEWHLPFDMEMDHDIDELVEVTGLSFLDIKKRISVARCAWVSYYMPGATTSRMYNLTAALNTYAKLIVKEPRHLSPAQHVATPLPESVRVGQFCGWLMHRKEIHGESGGDKVVPSITPEQAFEMLDKYKKGINT